MTIALLFGMTTQTVSNKVDTAKGDVTNEVSEKLAELGDAVAEHAQDLKRRFQELPEPSRWLENWSTGKIFGAGVIGGLVGATLLSPNGRLVRTVVRSALTPLLIKLVIDNALRANPSLTDEGSSKDSDEADGVNKDATTRGKNATTNKKPNKN